MISKFSTQLPLCERCRCELSEVGIDLNEYVTVKRQELLEAGMWSVS